MFKIFFWLQQSVEFTVTYNLLKVAEDACGLLEELTKCSHILPKCLKSRSLHSAGVLLGRVNVTNLAIVYSTGPVLFGDRGSGSRRGAERWNIYKYWLTHPHPSPYKLQGLVNVEFKYGFKLILIGFNLWPIRRWMHVCRHRWQFYFSCTGHESVRVILQLSFTSHNIYVNINPVFPQTAD